MTAGPRTRSRRGLSALVALAGALHAAGCKLAGDEPSGQPCGGLKVGDKLGITIVERRQLGPANPGSDCNDLLGDLPVGFTLEATLTGFEAGSSGNDACLSGRASVARTDDWSWQVPASAPRPGGDYPLETRLEASRGSCRGTVDLRLQGSIPSPAPDGGGAAAATFTRVFTRSAGDDGCPASCVGQFGVAVAKR